MAERNGMMHDIREGVNLVRSNDRKAGVARALCMAEDALSEGAFGSAVLVSPQKKVSDCRIENGETFSLCFSGRASTYPLNEWVIKWDEAMRAVEDVRAISSGDGPVSFTNGGYEPHASWALADLLKVSPDAVAPVLYVWDIWDDATVNMDELDAECRRLHLSAIAVMRETTGRG